MCKYRHRHWLLTKLRELPAYWTSAIRYFASLVFLNWPFTWCLVDVALQHQRIWDFLPLLDDRQRHCPEIPGFHKSEVKLDVYAKSWSPPDLHYNNTITTGVYNRMCLLFAYCRCLCVVRKWVRQHPGDFRAGGAAACVAPVITQRLPVQEGQKPSVSHPQSKHGRL